MSSNASNSKYKSMQQCMAADSILNGENNKYDSITPVNQTNKTIIKVKKIQNSYHSSCINKLLGGFLENISQSPLQYLFYHFYTYFSYLYISYLLRYNKGLDVEHDLSDILLSSFTIEDKKFKIQRNDKIQKLNLNRRTKIIDVACMKDILIQENLKKILSYLDPITYNFIYKYFCNENFKTTICDHFSIPNVDRPKPDTDITYLVLAYLIIFTFKYKDEDFNLQTSCPLFNNRANPLFDKIDGLFLDYKFYEAYPGPPRTPNDPQVSLNLQKIKIMEEISTIFYYMFPPAKINGEDDFIKKRADDFIISGPDGANLRVNDIQRGQIIDFTGNEVDRPKFIDNERRTYFYFAAQVTGRNTTGGNIWTSGYWYISQSRINDPDDRFRMYFKFTQMDGGYFYEVVDCPPVNPPPGNPPPVNPPPGNPPPVNTPPGYRQYTFAYDRNTHEWGWYTVVGHNGVPNGERLNVEIDSIKYYYKYHNNWGWFSEDNTRLPENGNFMYRVDPAYRNRSIRLQPSGETNLILQPRYIPIPKEYRSLLIFAAILEFVKDEKIINPIGHLQSFQYNYFFSNINPNFNDHPDTDNVIEQIFPLLHIYKKIVSSCINGPIPLEFSPITKEVIKFINKDSDIIHNYSLPRA